MIGMCIYNNKIKSLTFDPDTISPCVVHTVQLDY